MNNVWHPQETVGNGPSSRRDSPPLLRGDAVAYQPAAGNFAESPAAESVTFIWDDIQ